MNMKRAGKREWIGLAVLILPTLLLSIDVSVLHLAVPALSAGLRPTGAQLLWINDIYGFLIAGFLITMGTVGDRIGRRRLLLIGAAAFAVASALAAFAPSAEVLIAARALLGVAGATLMPSTLSLIRNMFHDPAQRTTAISVWMVGFTGGMVIGPLVGGVLLEHFWWGSVFLLGVPVMVLLLVAGPLLLPEYRAPVTERLDLVSVGLSIVAALSALLSGLLLALLFVRRQRTVPGPLLDLRLFAERRFSGSLGTLMLVILTGPGIGLLAAQYMQLVLGLSPLHAGLATVPWSLGFVVGSLLAPKLAHRWPATRVLGWGLVVAGVGLFPLLLADTRWGLAALILGTIVMSLALGPVFALGNEMIITSAPPERAGAASALSETSAEFSGAVGVAIFGSIGTVIYRAGLQDELPAGVSQDAATQALATLGGAVSAAADLPATVADALGMAARAAFVDALQAATVVASAILFGAAVLAVRMLRNGSTEEHAAHRGGR